MFARFGALLIIAISAVLYQINDIFPVFDAENTGGQGNPAPTIQVNLVLYQINLNIIFFDKSALRGTETSRYKSD